MKRVVITQPMFYPWVGMFEQLRLADVFIFYDDVQFSKGSFTNRVQVKTASGPQWLTVPLKDLHLGQPIATVTTEDQKDWRKGHVELLTRCYHDAPFFDEMMAVARRVYGRSTKSLCEVAVASMLVPAEYFSLTEGTEFLYASQLGISGQSWQRVLDIVKAVGGDIYITGHGAKNYLDHEAFERAGVDVEYMAYERQPYPQLFDSFDPHVTILDLIANLGKSGRDKILSGTVSWREFLTQ